MPEHPYYTKEHLLLRFNHLYQDFAYKSYQSVPDDDVMVNTTERPLLYSLSVSEYLSLSGIGRFSNAFYSRKIAFTALFLCLFLLSAWSYFSRKRLDFAPYDALYGGFFGLFIQIMSMMLFQISFGSLYWVFGLFSGIYILAGSLSALFLPSFWKIVHSRLLLFSSLLILSVAFFLPAGFQYVLPLLCSFLSGFATGSIFSVLSTNKKTNPSLYYITDLAGAGAVSFLPSLFLVPAFGFVRVLTAFLILCSIWIGTSFFKTKNP
jgi:hypothetical protein